MEKWRGKKKKSRVETKIRKRKWEYLAFKVFGLQGRKEREKKKNPHAIVQILSSLYFLPIWEERKMLALWRTMHFPFPRSISLQTNKWFFFSFLPFPSLAFPPATLQPNIYIYIYIEHFLPIVFINHCIEYGVVQELTKPFIYLFMYFLERWKWNTWWRKWGLPMYFKGFYFSNAKKKKKKKKGKL